MEATAIYHSSIPDEITINHNWTCRKDDPNFKLKEPFMAEPNTIESVRRALESGPFAAIAALGPRCFEAEPMTFEKQIPGHLEQSVFGWKSTAKRICDTEPVGIIVCGAQARGTGQYIYYVLADYISKSPDHATGKFKPSSDEKRIFVTSLEKFNQVEFDMFPPVTAQEVKDNESEIAIPGPIIGNPKEIAAWKSGQVTYSRDGKKWMKVEHPQPPPIPAGHKLVAAVIPKVGGQPVWIAVPKAAGKEK